MKKLMCVCLLMSAFYAGFCQAVKKNNKIKSIPVQEKKMTAGTLPVKVVIITMFENGKDSGDSPGEFQYWVEKVPLKDTISFPQGYRNLRYNPEKQILAICTGMGTARSAASIMALGMDTRFDLSKAYWIVAGIAGIDPEDGTVGSAVWSEWLVDGDLAHEIDPRESPSNWTTGYFPLNKTKPYEEPKEAGDFNVAQHLNSGLVKWAYQLTKDIKLKDSEKAQKFRMKYSTFPEAQKPPRVMLGDHLASMTYWHGKYNNDWANSWVKYWTGGKGDFVTSAMEDTGTGQALEFLQKAGKADFNRYMVLRTGSNFTMQYPGITAIQSLASEGQGDGEGDSAYLLSLDAAYRTGIVVVEDIINNWEKYKDAIPGN
jgi:purine nucleoside permease